MASKPEADRSADSLDPRATVKTASLVPATSPLVPPDHAPNDLPDELELQDPERWDGMS